MLLGRLHNASMPLTRIRLLKHIFQRRFNFSVNKCKFQLLTFMCIGIVLQLEFDIGSCKGAKKYFTLYKVLLVHDQMVATMSTCWIDDLTTRHVQSIILPNQIPSKKIGREASPSKTCLICNSLDTYTWLHVPLKCTQQHIHAIITKRHNKVVQELCKFLVLIK